MERWEKSQKEHRDVSAGYVNFPAAVDGSTGKQETGIVNSLAALSNVLTANPRILCTSSIRQASVKRAALERTRERKKGEIAVGKTRG